MYSILHHGAVTGVTGSCHELFLDSGLSLLVDCGLFQGAEATPGDSADSLEQRSSVDFDISAVRALFITHCHIDHVGRLPWLLSAGFKGPIYATQATCELLPLVLEDALKIGVTRDRRLIERVVKYLQTLLVPCDYKERVAVNELSSDEFEVTACFQVAGHILGSAWIEFEITHLGENPVSKVVVFSGDLGCKDTPLLPDPAPLRRADTLVMESTYGDSLHGDRSRRRHRLEKVLERCLANAGTVIIPAFSIGRTQELLYELEDIFHSLSSDPKNGDVAGGVLHERIDVIVDSPLAARFTESYRNLVALWDEEAKERMKSGRHPLAFDQLLTIESHQDHMNAVGYLRRTGRPAIVIAASGMCSGGRVMNYLKALLPDDRTDVLFVGYQAKGTPGRDIQHWGPKGGYVVIDDRRIDIKANIEVLSGYSAHADQQGLIDFVFSAAEPPKKIILVHGDAEAKADLKNRLQALLPSTDVSIGKG